MAGVLQKILIFAFTLLTTPNTTSATTEFSVDPPTCIATGRYPAPACYQYYDCVYIMWWWEAQVVTCPDTQSYDINLKACALATLVDCQFRTPLPGLTSTTTSTTTTTTTTVTPPIVVPGLPNCTGPGKHPAPSCYDYYDCVQDSSLWKPVLTTCYVGYAFDILIIACVPVVQCDCQNRLTTTTKSTSTSTTSIAPPVIGPPSCTGPGKHPAPSCYDYYECVQDSTLWKPVLTTCYVGYAFDILIIACVPVAQCDCQNRLTTTTSTTSLAPPIIIGPPSCTGPGKHPAPSCYDYYECVQDSTLWKPILTTCYVGYAFDIWIIACVPVAQCDCQNRLTTTTSTTSLAPPIIIGPPSCTGPGKHPAQSCYDYYECEQTLWWWTPVLKNCVIGYAFDILIIACVPVKQCDCQNRLTTTQSSTTSTTSIAPPVIIGPPSCTGPGKHPAESCYDYYECEQELWWWSPVLKNCVIGYAFDILIIACVPVKQCDCQNRLTTTQSSTTSTSLAPPIVIPPTCTGPGKHPALSCYGYYECVQEGSLWRPVFQNCAIGYAFDIFIIICVPVKQCDCQNRLTTTQSSTTSTTVVPIVVPPACTGPGKHPALSCYNYYECVQEGWWWTPVLKNCVVGYAFDVFIIACVPVKQCDCQNRATTSVSPTTSTTTLAPPIIGPPSCTGPGKHPAPSCYDYYECEQELWWWKPVHKTCIIGYAFDIFIIACVPIKQCNCQNRVTTTAPTSSTTSPAPPIINPPSCSGPGKHPAQSCYDYYECEQELWWWKPVHKTCITGYAFDIFIIACVPVKHCNCHNRVTTTVSTTTSTTTIAPPVIVPPACSGPGKHPAPSCYQYYECKQNLWWWETVLQTCTIGYAFDVFIIACVPKASVDCQHRITTTLKPTTPRPTRPRPPPPIVVPSCSGPSKHPSSSCYQYYECVQVWWWWEPKLLSCDKGHAFDVPYSECRLVKYVDCHHRRTTTIKPTTSTTAVTPVPPAIVVPACYGPGKHPAPICYQYYECIQVGWWWVPELKSCLIGEAFDIALAVCYPGRAVDCQHRTTTTRVPKPTTAVTTPRPPPRVPVCHGYSKHPAPLCYQYYECVQNWWWWEPKLKTCPDGEGYDHRKRRCFCAAAIGCRLPVTEPKCSEPGHYPASKCGQYYDCVPYFWWWQPELKDCPKGQGFATSIMRCVDEGYDCTLSGDGSSENSSKENGSKENGSKENGSKENGSKENSSKENTSQEKSSKEVDV